MLNPALPLNTGCTVQRSEEAFSLAKSAWSPIESEESRMQNSVDGNRCVFRRNFFSFQLHNSRVSRNTLSWLHSNELYPFLRFCECFARLSRPQTDVLMNFFFNESFVKILFLCNKSRERKLLPGCKRNPLDFRADHTSCLFSLFGFPHQKN